MRSKNVNPSFLSFFCSSFSSEQTIQLHPPFYFVSSPQLFTSSFYSSTCNATDFKCSSSSLYFYHLYLQVNNKRIFSILSNYTFLDMRIVCYYANWSLYRLPHTPILYPDYIDPSLCTHIHIAFALINPTTLKIEPSEKHDTNFSDKFGTVMSKVFCSNLIVVC